MAEAAAALIPLLGFMLIPLWIPLVAVVAGSVADSLADRRGLQADSAD